MLIYSSTDYKAILKDSLLEKKAVLGSHYTFQRMATACRIEKAYLSRTLNGDAHLNADQLHLACRFLGFSSEEEDYLHLLLRQTRAAVPSYRKKLEKEIRSLQKRVNLTESHIKAEPHAKDSVEMMEYFLDPNVQLVHMFLTVKRFAEDPKLIAPILQITMDRVLELVAKLERLEFIQLRGSSYQVLRNNLHLSSESHHFRLYRQLTRLKSMERLQNLSNDQAYSFSVSFSATTKVRKQLQDEFMKFLSKAEASVKQSDGEDVFQMNFDLFPWT